MATDRGRAQTRAAIAKRMRNAEERWAKRLEERGWVCIPDPTVVDEEILTVDNLQLRKVTVTSLYVEK